MHRGKRMRPAGGFTLVEVLVTIVVLSLGVLGVAGLQMSTMRATRAAYYRSQAAILAQQIVAAMRANRSAAVRAGSYDTGFSDRVSCRDGVGLAACDLARWKAALASRLPHGRGRVRVSGDNRVTVCVRWRPPHRRRSIANVASVCRDSLDGRRQFALETVL